MISWADVPSLAWQFDVSHGTIRRWACEDRWTPRGTRRSRTWNVDEAYHSWHRRHAAASPYLCPDLRRT